MLLLVRRFKHLEFMSDRFRRYFLYALGEMVLVVVGILIALQIDNWNSNRQDDARLQSHLQSIARNVGEDLAELQALKSFRQEAVVDGWRVLDYLTAQSTFSTKDISLYSKARFEASAQEIFAANTSGYDSLKNSDVLGRLQGNDIENLLADYYDVVGRIENLEASHNSYVRSLEVPFILEYPPEAESYAFITPDSLPGERFEELQPVYHRRINSALSHALIGSTSNLSVLLRYYQRLETLGRTYVRLVNRGTMNLNAEDAAILAGMRDWVTGLPDPALVAKGSPNLGSYYIGRESALGAAVFDIHSLALTDEGVADVMAELSKQFDYIICDSPAGIERGAQLAMYHADEAIIVTNPEISSVRDSDRIIGILQSRTKKVEENQGSVREHLIITRYNAERAAANEMMDIDTISNDILKVPLLGVIPESHSVLEASNHGEPVIHYADSVAGQCYDDIVARFLGEERPLRHLEVKKKSFLQRWFGG